MGFARVLFGLFLVLLALYGVLSVWLRLRERRRLAAEWQARAEGSREAAGSREAFVAAGMAEYDGSLRKRLLWGVVVLPMAGFVLLLYLLNMS